MLYLLYFQNPGLFYFSGFKNPKEDILRDKRVLHTKRKLPPLQPVEKGIELVRTGRKDLIIHYTI